MSSYAPTGRFPMRHVTPTKPLLASAAILVVGVLALLLDVRLTDGASALIVPFLVTCAAAASLVARSVVC
jgi:hypothetical protein